MHILDAGRGLPVLLLHAFPFDARMWEHQIHALSSSYRVLAPDFPGFGASAPERALTLDGWASNLLDQLDATGVHQAVVVGCSMGGYAAFAMLRRQPSFFTGFALVNSRAAADDDAARERRRGIIEQVKREGTSSLIASTIAAYESRPQALALVRQMLADATAEGIIGAQQAMLERPDSSDLLGAIRVPKIVVHGVLDELISTAEAQALARAIAGARFERIEGARHVPSLDQPDAVTAVLWQFVEHCERKIRPGARE